MTAPTTPAAQRRRRYERIVRIVEYNTGGKQAPTVAEHTVVLIAERAGIDPGDARSALKAARQNGDLFAFDGRYATPESFQDEETILEAIRHEAQREEPCSALIARGNEALQRIRWNRGESA